MKMPESLDTRIILELYASGMTFKDVAKTMGMTLGQIRHIVTSSSDHYWIHKCHKMSLLCRQLKMKSKGTWSDKRTIRKKNRQKQGLCVECGNPVGKIIYSGRGRPPNGYRCQACNQKIKQRKERKNVEIG